MGKLVFTFSTSLLEAIYRLVKLANKVRGLGENPERQFHVCLFFQVDAVGNTKEITSANPITKHKFESDKLVK